MTAQAGTPANAPSTAGAKTARQTGLLAVGIGVVVLAGWVAGLDALRRPVLHGPAMFADAAFVLVLAGLALRAGSSGSQWSAVSAWLGAVVLVFGLVALVQPLFGGALADRRLSFPSSAPGSLAPGTAGSFAALGAALLLARGRGRAALAAQVLAIAVLFVAINAAFGFIYDLEGLYHWGDTAPMALPAAVGSGILAVGVFYATGSEGLGGLLLDRSAGGMHVRWLLPAVVAVPLLLGMAAVQGNRSGLIGDDVAASLVSTVHVLVLGGIVWLMGASLRSLDRSRLAATAQLGEREQLYRATFHNAFVGIAHVGLDGRLLRVNARLAELLGWESGTLEGRSASELLSEADQGKLDAMLRRAARGEMQGFSAECRLRSRSDAPMWVDVRGTVQGAEGREEPYLILVLADITERRRSASLLRIQQRALHAAGSGIAIADAASSDYPIVDVNPAFERLTGWEREELVGRGLLERLGSESSEVDGLRTALDRGEARALVLQSRRKDGVLFWNQVSITPVFDVEGRPTHFVGVLEDVSADIRAEEERRRLLAKAIEDREAAERANRAREMLLAVVSHELRGPLNAVRLWSSLLPQVSRDDQVLRAARQIERSVQAQSRMIEDLIDISRMASGELELNLEAVDIAEILTENVETLQPDAALKHLTLRATLPPGRAVARGDRVRLSQVVRNLLDNAMKFTPDGGVIEARLTVAKEELEISVLDTGSGLDETERRQVFDWFWQADRRDTRSHGGLGLGLSIVRHIVTRHGGRVQVQSEGKGKGARFSVWLPLLQDGTVRDTGGAPEQRGHPALATAGVVLPRAESAAERAGGDVLVVDDDLATAEALALALRVRGHAVRTATSVDEAVVEMHSSRPKILISDLMMPDKTGVDLIELIRREESEARHPRVYAIAITGRGGPSDRERVLTAGFDAYLTKPVELRVLERTMARPSGGVRCSD